MISENEAAAMSLAIRLSARGLGSTSPNPPVGCVILDGQGQIAGTGYHQRKGEPHAEIHALTAAAAKAKGGTALVTLEPCNHVGLTPACHQALLDAGVERVLIALMDPTSRAEGGASKLRAAGVDVEVDVLADDARQVLGFWLDALQRGRPTVTATNSATTVDQRRSGYDVVIFGDGLIEEGRPHSHGTGFLGPPAKPADADAASLLAELYVRGARSALLLADRIRFDQFLSVDCVDSIELTFEETKRPEWTIPQAFVLAQTLNEATALKYIYERRSTRTRYA